MKKSVQMNDDDLRQLFTSLESSFSQIISLRSELTEDDRISRFQSFDAEDATESFNVIVRRKSKRKKSQLIEFDQFSQSGLLAINQTSLDVTKIQIDLENQFSSRNIESVDLNETNILSDDQKRTRKLISRYAQIVWENEEMRKFSSFHAAFMIGLFKSTYVNQSDQSDQLSSKNRSHISNLSSSSAHWRAMLRHFHAKRFRKAAQIEYDAIENRDIWQIVDRLKNEDHQIISLKWIFTYKTDSNDYLIKYKARIVIRSDLQMIDSQNVYAITLISKVFRISMTLVAAFNLKTRQLNAINAFLNAHNDELIYCQIFDDYRLDEKVIKIIRALYEQRKSSLLWLRMLIIKCIQLRLFFIFEELCVFINRNEIFMFFYVDDIVFAYRVDRQQAVELLISKLKDIFEMRNLGTLKFFLRMRVIQKSEMIFLVQDVYAEKLIKEYEISINQKTFISLSYQSLISYMREVDSIRIHTYRQKVKSICYSAIIIRSNIAKIAFKLAEFLINSDSYHLMIADHCIRYLHVIRHFAIKFDVSISEKLIIQADFNPNSVNQTNFDSNKYSNKQIFETSVDASFANEEERRSDENYIFKLFDDLIDWAARKQVIISTSITEIELLAMLHADKKFIWWIHLFEKLRFNLDQKMIIYNDNLQIIHLLTSEIAKMNIKLRHVDIAQCWLRQSVQQEKINVNYLLTAHMMIDEMIKLLSSQRHKQFIQQLRLMNVKSLMNDEISR